MSEYNARNYTEQGGDVTHIGGKLVIEPGAIVEGLPYARYQEDSTATTVAGLKDGKRSIKARIDFSHPVWQWEQNTLTALA